MRARDNGGIIGPLNLATIGAASGIWSLVDQELQQLTTAWPYPNPPFFEYLIVASGGTTLSFGITGTILPYTGTITYNPLYSQPYGSALFVTAGTISIIAYPLIYGPIRSIAATLTTSYTVNTQRPNYRVYQFTAGTGNIIF